jgi:lipopolysaccharide export system protein LptA
MKKAIRLFLCLLIIQTAVAQAQPPASTPAAAPPADTSNLEILPGSGRYSFEKKDSVTTIVTLAHRARVKQGNTLIEADSAIVNLYTKVMEAFGNVHINDSDTMNTYSQYVKYLGKERTAVLRTAVRLNDSRGGILNTDELNYDLNTHIGSYDKGGKIINKQTTLTSKGATYYGETKDIIFKKDVVLIDPQYRLATDSLLYNTTTEIARFVSPTTIVTKDRTIYTKDGFYNLRTGAAVFSERATIRDSVSTISADNMAFDDKNNKAQFRGNVSYQDSSVSLLSGVLNLDRQNGNFLATVKPVMILKQKKDSVFITGDTLYSGKITDRQKIKPIPVITDSIKSKRVFDLNGKDSSQNRFFEAFHHVRIYNDSMQAVCDSLFYASTDSVFRLYQNPIMWASNSQITADTIYLYTLNKQPERLYAFENGFIINQVNNKAYYNQVKGRTINGYFVNGNINYVRTKGNAESVYYATDDSSKFIGVNKATADAIDMYFKEKQANKVVFRKDLKGTTYPIRQAPADELELRGFRWLESRRPKNKFELFE